MRPLPRLIVVLLLTIAPVGSAVAADIMVTPSLSVGEEFVDNVYLTHSMEKDDYITHLVPALRAEYEAPLWNWKLDYAYDRRYYARHSYEDDNAQTLSLRNTTRIMKDILAFDIQDDYGRISISSIQDFTQESLVRYLTEYNDLKLNPRATLQLTSGATVTAGYQYRNVWYKDPHSVDRTVQSVYGDLGWATGAHTRLYLSVRQDNLSSKLVEVDRSEFLAGPRYDAGGRLQAWFRGGAAATNVAVSGMGRSIYPVWDRQLYPVWDGGLDHRGPILELHLETGRTWIEDPNNIEIREDRFIATLRGRSARTSSGVTLARRDYGWARETVTRKYTVSLDIRHDVTERLTGTFSVTGDRYNLYDLVYRDIIDSRTMVYNIDGRLEHKAAEGLTIALNYHFTTSRTPGAGTLAYDVNRLLIEVKKVF